MIDTLDIIAAHLHKHPTHKMTVESRSQSIAVAIKQGDLVIYRAECPVREAVVPTSMPLGLEGALDLLATTILDDVK